MSDGFRKYWTRYLEHEVTLLESMRDHTTNMYLCVRYFKDDILFDLDGRYHEKSLHMKVHF